MQMLQAPWLCFFLLSLFHLLSNSCFVLCRSAPDSIPGQLQKYIVQVEKPTQVLDEQSLRFWYNSFLPESGDDSDRLIHSYTDVFSGFSAELTEEELEEVSKKDGFVRAYRNRVLPLLTTHTPDFLGLKVGGGLWKSANLGEGIIIGVLDSGITPGHPSFDDEGVPPPPAKWKGSCSFSSGCNNKLIGAKSMISRGSAAPTDSVGHGTHTASTAAGNFVRNVSIHGLDVGTAAGMAPLAHLAIYQVCDAEGCSGDSILAGMDAAVKDGVDLLSLSLGGGSLSFDEDPIAIGAFGAIERGVFVICAGGNSGPSPSSVANEAPWILTVAASTVDRTFRATVKLGNGKVLKSESLDQKPSFFKRPFPLHYGGDCAALSEADVKGKVVLCDVDRESNFIGESIRDAGGVVAILVDQFGYDTLIISDVGFPAAFVTQEDGETIRSYANSSSNPSATLQFDGTILGTTPSPVVAFFSSRGPSLAAPGIIKPDISGPGVNIIAAWLPEEGSYGFNVNSGTSMATPHLSGVAALIKRVHPKWSPAAIKSAIITTSISRGRDTKPIQDEAHQPASFFAMGAGNVNPGKAVDPGLVYDLSTDDYISYLCGKFDSSSVSSIVSNTSVDCSIIKSVSEADLNYPSILVVSRGGEEITVSRTVTNVGPATSTYKAEAKLPKAATVTVEPKTLVFSRANEKKSFKVTAKWTGDPDLDANFVQGDLKWVSEKHVVRSPVVVFKNPPAV